MEAKGENISSSEMEVMNSSTSAAAGPPKVSSFLSWLRYYFAMPKTCILIECVLISNAVIDAAVFMVLVTYLTDFWSMKLILAAGTVNVWEGMSGLLSVLANFLKERYGCYKTVLMCISLYIMGFVGLYISLLYAALPLLALGKALSNSSCVQDFLEDQLTAQSKQLDKKRNDVRNVISQRKCRIIGVVLGNILFAFFSWEVSFAISAIVQLISLILFLIGTPLYFKGRYLSLIHMILYLFDKVGRPISEDSSLSSPPPPYSKLIAKTESNTSSSVVQLRLLIPRMAPICLTFLMYGIVDSIGSTFFLEEEKTMDKSLGDLSHGNKDISSNNLLQNQIPLILQIIMTLSRFVSKYLVDCILSKRLRGSSVHATLIRIGLGMLFSVGVCSIAQAVEAERLNVVRKYDLLEQPDKVVPMSVFWLLPQFICLGTMNGLAGDGLEEFFEEELPWWIKSYAPTFAEALIHVGTLLSGLLMFIVEIINELSGQNGWLVDSNVNKSRLDHVYRMLTIFGLLNLYLFAHVATKYVCNDTQFMNHRQETVSGNSQFHELEVETNFEVEPEDERPR